MSASNYVTFDVDEIVRETDAAFLLRIEDEEHWIPKSQIADASDYAMGDVDCSMSLTEFIARQKGLL